MTWHGLSEAPKGKVSLDEDEWELLSELSEASEYWEAAHHFLEGVDGRGLSTLSERQLDWYNQIRGSLSVELNRRTSRRAFGLLVEEGIMYSDRGYEER